MNIKPSATRVLAPASVVVLLLLCFVFAASYSTTRASQLETRHTIAGMVTRSTITARIGHDLAEKQLLTDRHIFEKGAANMVEVEGRLRIVNDDLSTSIAAAEQQYQDNPEMLRSLDEIRSDLGALSPRLADVVELSRRNRDEEAQTKMLGLVPDLERLDMSATRLLGVSHHDGVESLARSGAAQARGTLWLSVLSAVGIVIVAAILFVAMRDVRRQHDETWQLTRRLEEQNRELDAFAARVAHDLRGPLTTINLAAERLSERLPDERGTSDILRRGVRRMEALIRDLLALSHVDRQAPDAASDPSTVAASVARELNAPVAEAGGTLELSTDVGRVRCSEGLLRDVLWNLVENALKYRGTAPPAIRVDGHRAGDVYEIRVRDNGIGMSADEAHHAFDAFYRGARAPGVAAGTGLGLSIVKRIVEVSTGTIAIESEVDHGTTVIVDLPLARPA